MKARPTQKIFWESILIALFGKLYQTHVNVSITHLIFYQVFYFMFLYLVNIPIQN